MERVLGRIEQQCPECDGRDFVDDIASGDFVCKVLPLISDARNVPNTIRDVDLFWNPIPSMSDRNGERFQTRFCIWHQT